MGSKVTRSIRGLSTTALLLGGIIGLAACASDQGSRSTEYAKPPSYSGWTDEGSTPVAVQPARAAEPAPARVVPAAAVGPCPGYAPAMSGAQSASMMAFPTGDARTSALLVHHVTPKEVRLNESYDYTIHVTNLTQGTLQNVVVTQVSRDNLEVASSKPAFTKGGDGNLNWALADLGPCETEVITISAKATKIGTASDCITVSYNNALCAAVRVVEPALALRKTITPEVLLCDAINIQFEVKNTGTGVARDVVVRDQLASGLATADGKNVIEIPAGNLGAGETKVLNAVVRASKTGRYENVASATSSGGLKADSNSVATVVRQPVLTIACQAREAEYIGRDLTYRLCVKNTGDAPANDTVVTANVPAGATFVSATDGGTVAGGNVTFRLGSIAPNAERCVSLVVRPVNAGDYRVQASASAACATAVNTTCNTNLRGIPAILLEVIDISDPLLVGDNETYLIIVTNQGSAPGTNIRVTCTVPAAQEFVSASGATAGSAQGKVVTFAPLASLAPKARAEYRVVTRATGEGDVRFQTTLTSDQFTRPIEETESTNQYK
ncbi:MAG TPA: hypothetical protein DEB06_01145 [Phycisphaerales bacterium]|nr:hypothetical protein [Phycisphaerales bacterium]